MTSKERKEARYQRRKQKRIDIINKRSEMYANIDNAFCFHKVMYYANKCCNGVRWKKSTKIFDLHSLTNIATTCYNIKNDCYKVRDTFKFTINERGKTREIDAPHICDRLVHKVLCNEIIVPIYENNLIYDNGASITNKGFIFAINRVRKKLEKFYNIYKDNLYIVLIDFSNFFHNCDHAVIHDIHLKYIKDYYCIKVIEDYLFIDKGISLGIEIAQREASIIPNVLDHYILNNSLFIERYMDDTIFFTDSYNKAVELLNKYKELCNKYNIIINNNKTKIINADNFIFCKWKFLINKNKIIPVKKTLYRQRKKLKKMIKKQINYKETLTSFCAYLKLGNSNDYILSLFRILFDSIKNIDENDAEYYNTLDLMRVLECKIKDKNNNIVIDKFSNEDCYKLLNKYFYKKDIIKYGKIYFKYKVI